MFVGAACVDVVLKVPLYPGEDEEIRVQSVTRRTGGNAANAAVTFASLARAWHRSTSPCDINCQLVAAVSDPQSDSESKFLLSALAVRGIDTSSMVTVAPRGLPVSYIALTSSSRTIFHHRSIRELDCGEMIAGIIRGIHVTPSSLGVQARLGHQSAEGSGLPPWIHFEGRAVDDTLQTLKWIHEQSTDAGAGLSQTSHTRVQSAVVAAPPCSGDSSASALGRINAPLTQRPVISVEIEKKRDGAASELSLLPYADVIFLAKEYVLAHMQHLSTSDAGAAAQGGDALALGPCAHDRCNSSTAGADAAKGAERSCASPEEVLVALRGRSKASSGSAPLPPSSSSSEAMTSAQDGNLPATGEGAAASARSFQHPDAAGRSHLDIGHQHPRDDAIVVLPWGDRGVWASVPVPTGTDGCHCDGCYCGVDGGGGSESAASVVDSAGGIGGSNTPQPQSTRHCPESVRHRKVRFSHAIVHVPSHPPSSGEVIDTIGAGDCFIGAFIAYAMLASERCGAAPGSCQHDSGGAHHLGGVMNTCETGCPMGYLHSLRVTAACESSARDSCVPLPHTHADNKANESLVKKWLGFGCVVAGEKCGQAAGGADLGLPALNTAAAVLY